MPKRFRLQRPDWAAVVTSALADCKEVRSHQRLLAMRLAASGQFTAAQIAEQIGIRRRQFFHWVNALKAGGVARLLAREQGGGRPARIQGPALQELQSGLPAGRWKRAKDIQAWLRQRHDPRRSVKGVYDWLGKLGGVLKVPRKTPAQKDATQVAVFQRTLCAQLKNLNAAGGPPVRVRGAAAHREGLIPVVRRGWTLRGVRPTAPYQTQYEGGISTVHWRWTGITPPSLRACPV